VTRIGNLTRCLEAVHSGHRDIQDGYVGRKSLGLRHRFHAVFHFRADPPILPCGEQPSQYTADAFSIVSYKNGLLRDHFVTRHFLRIATSAGWGLPEGVQKIHFSSAPYNTEHRCRIPTMQDPNFRVLLTYQAFQYLQCHQTRCRRCPISHSDPVKTPRKSFACFSLLIRLYFRQLYA
jgi:hypothetical protein